LAQIALIHDHAGHLIALYDASQVRPFPTSRKVAARGSRAKGASTLGQPLVTLTLPTTLGRSFTPPRQLIAYADITVE
jgi:hypothetical protein